MKKMILSLALLLCVGSVSAQDDKAAAKAAKAAAAAAKKEAKAQVAEALKIKEAIYAKMTEKTATDEEITTECKKGHDLVWKALQSGNVEPNKEAEAWKLANELSQPLLNNLLACASSKVPFDTAMYYDNLKKLTEGYHQELTKTKVVKGDTGNEAQLKAKNMNLGKSCIYYIYAAQFEADAKRYKSALEAYDYALSYKEKYPECAENVQMSIEDSQIAYYAFMTAHEAGDYESMDKYYEKALGFKDGALGVKQTKLSSYLEKGDTTAWANAVHDVCIAKPSENEDYIQMLLAFYQKKGTEEMGKFADEVIAADPNILIANYGKAYVFFSQEKYDDALKLYEKCTEIKPDYYDAWYQCGLCKFRQALALNATISGIKDQKKAKATLEQTKALFGDALPYFEKARDCAPDEPNKWAYELKQCYSATGKADKAAEMDKLL